MSIICSLFPGFHNLKMHCFMCVKSALMKYKLIPFWHTINQLLRPCSAETKSKLHSSSASGFALLLALIRHVASNAWQLD